MLPKLKMLNNGIQKLKKSWVIKTIKMFCENKEIDAQNSNI